MIFDVTEAKKGQIYMIDIYQNDYADAEVYTLLFTCSVYWDLCALTLQMPGFFVP